jgi:hypothetical protein
VHLEHGVCHSFGFFRVRVTHQLAQRSRAACPGVAARLGQGAAPPIYSDH